MATVADLVPKILDRIEETNPPVFWVSDEVNFAAIEAINELMLLVGRPTQTVRVPFTIQPNTTWQQVPKNVFAITNIQGMASEVYKVTLEDFDYLQVYAGSDWENDVGQVILQWCPLGFRMFAVHPCTSDVQTVLITGIAVPCQQTYPYTPLGITIPFEDQWLVTLEKYAAGYLAFKEAGSEFEAGARLYAEFLKDAQRMTELEDRRDPYIFHLGTGVPVQSNPSAMR